MSDDDNCRRMVELGQSLLEQQLEDQSGGEHSGSFSDSVYIHTVQLSTLLKSLQIHAIDNISLSASDIKSIMRKLEIVVDDLECVDKGPAPEMGPGASTYEAYRVVCFALMVLQKNPINEDPELVSQNHVLAEKVKKLQSKLAQKSECQAAELIEYLREEYDITHTSMPAFLSELKKKRKLERDSRCTDNMRQELESKEAKIAKLKKQIEEFGSSSCMSNSDQSGMEKQLCELTLQNQRLQLDLEMAKQEKIELAAELQENMKITEEFSQRFQAMQQQLANNESNNDLTNAKYFVMETDLQAATLRCKELQKDNKKAKEKIRQLTKILRDFEDAGKAKDAEIDRLKMENEKTILQRDELEQKMAEHISMSGSDSEVALKEREIQKLNQALIEVAAQMEAVSEELAAETEAKTQLFAIVEKQNAALNAVEGQTRVLTNELKKEQQAKSSAILAKEGLEKKMESMSCNHEQVAENVTNYLSEKLEESDAKNEIMSSLSNNELSTSQKVIAAIEGLLNVSEKCSEARASEASNAALVEQNERLMTYISNIAHFIDQVANSHELQSWMVDDGYEDEYRPILMAQCGRLDAFIKQNQLSVDTSALCGNFTEIPELLKSLVSELASENREVVLMIQILCLANEVMRKYATHLVEQNQNLSGDVSQLRHELRQTNEDTFEQIDEATHSLSSELEDEKEKNRNAQEVLKKIYKNLKRTGNKDDAVNRCLEMLDGEVDPADCNAMNEFETELQDVTEERDIAIQKAVDLTDRLQKQKTKLKQAEAEISENKKLIGEMEIKVNDLTTANAVLNVQMIQLEAERQELRTTVSQQMEELEKTKEETLTALNSMESAFTARINEKEVEIEDLKQKHVAAELAAEEEKKELERERKNEEKKLRNECALQAQRTEELRNHFEPILADLRAKVNEARTSMSQSQSALQKAESANKEMKSELSSTRIDLKMSQMKLAAFEEKMKREKSLIETQNRMKVMNMETEHQAALEEQKSDFEAQHHAFLVAVCEKFKEFVDFAAPISEESVSAVLDDVSSSLHRTSRKAVALEATACDLENIRAVLGINDSTPLMPAVTAFAKEVAECAHAKRKLDEEKKAAAALIKQAKSSTANDNQSREWEQWAKRVHSLVSDSFSSAKTPKELQNALEEVLMGGIGQRQIKRRLEILRIEKHLLTSGLVKQPSPAGKKPAPTLRTMICIAAAVHKLQKLSGHLPCSLGNPRRGGERTDVSPLKARKFPIINVA